MVVLKMGAHIVHVLYVPITSQMSIHGSATSVPFDFDHHFCFFYYPNSKQLDYRLRGNLYPSLHQNFHRNQPNEEAINKM